MCRTLGAVRLYCRRKKKKFGNVNKNGTVVLGFYFEGTLPTSINCVELCGSM